MPCRGRLAELVGNFFPLSPFPFPQGNRFDGCVIAYKSAGAAEEIFGNVFVALQC